MQEVFQQIRERHRQNPNHIHGRGRPLANPNPKPVHPLDLRSCIPPENLKASSLQQGSNNGKSCAKRECLCDLTSAIARKVPTKPHLEPNEKERSFTLLADLREQEEGEGLAGDNNDEDCSARRSSHRWNSDSLSFARHCEAKLEDLLNLDGSALNTFNESPDAQRTDACFHVLEELCENKLPFSCVLQHICDELRGALYQKSQDRTRKASSEQVRAYFELAHELEGEVAQMEAENSSWRSSVLAQDHDLLDTKGELQELADELSKANCASNELEEKLSATEQALSSEKEKVCFGLPFVCSKTAVCGHLLKWPTVSTMLSSREHDYEPANSCWQAPPQWLLHHASQEGFEFKSQNSCWRAFAQVYDNTMLSRRRA